MTYNLYSQPAAGLQARADNAIAHGLVATNYSNTGLLAVDDLLLHCQSRRHHRRVRQLQHRASATTPSGGGGGLGCHITYADQNDWGTGFTGAVSIQNTGTQQINGWTLTWTWSGNQQIYQSWNSNYTQTGQSVALTNASWNGTIGAGDTLNGIGFNANYSGTNNNPTTFYVNGTVCH